MVWLLQRTDAAGGVTVIIDALLSWLEARLPYKVVKVVQRSQHASWVARRRPLPWRLLTDATAFLRLLLRLLRERPAVIVTFTPAFGAVAALIARLWGGRTIVTHHTPRSNIRSFARWVDAFAQRQGAVTVVLACSESVADSFGDSALGRPVVVANGVPDVRQGMDQRVDRAWLADRHAVPADVPLALAVGKLGKEKQHSLLLDALAGVPDWHLVVAGEGPLREVLLARAEELGMRQRVHLVGRLEGPAVWALMALADAYVQPSLAEGMSLALLEALSAGAVCLVSDIPSNAEVVQPGSAGWCLPAREPKAWSEAMRRLMDAPDQAMALRHRARRAYEERFTERHMLEGYEQAIRVAVEG